MKVRITEKKLASMIRRGKTIKKQFKKLDNELNKLFWKASDEADRLEDRHMRLEEMDNTTKKQEAERRMLAKLIDKLDKATDVLHNIHH